jgi:predicted metal-dependent HD superfamily phosphohydrolase
MKERFNQLWKRINAQGSVDRVFAELSAMYSEPHRFYHNMTHVENCIFELDSARDLTHQPDLVEFALWYHDAIYNIRAEDNEEQSAQLAYDVCLAAQLPQSFTQGTRDLILSTTHRTIPQGIDARVLIDVDLSILGKSPEEFDEYEKNITREYAEVIKTLSEKEFKIRRLGKLSPLLTRAERHELYLTDFFRGKYETQAKVNLQRSIDAL